MSGNIKEYIKYIARGISPLYDNDGIVVLNQKCIRNQKISLEESRIHNIHKKSVSEDKILHNFDVLINSTGVGTLGRVAQVKNIKDKITVDSHITIVRPNLEKINGEFFGYCIKVQEDFIETLGTGATGQTELSRDAILDNVVIPNYSKENQRKLAKILSNYDDLIENNNKRIKILEEMAQKIYKEWFVNFKYPGHETATFKDSEFGKIPSDWHIGCIKELNNVQGGYAFKSTDLKEFGEYGVIKIKNIQAGTVDISFCQHVDMINTKKYEKFKLSAGDLLVALTGAQVGKVGIMPYSKKIFYLNQRVGKFIPNNDFIKNNQYVLMYVSSDKFATQVNNIASGAAQPNISTSQIENIPMIVASDPIIALYEDKVDSICKKIQVIKAQNAILQETRNILLPRLMSGEINVEDLEIA